MWSCWLSLVVGCASPLTAVREDNKRLTQTVTGLRADRRAQDRKVRDLQRQLDSLRAQIVTSVVDGSMPSLPVEVAAPLSSGTTPSSPLAHGARVVGIADDGTEIVYEGDAAAGKVGTLEDEGSRYEVSNEVSNDSFNRASSRVTVSSRRAPPPATTRVASVDRLEGTHRVPAVSARTARTHARARDVAPVERSDEAANAYRVAVDLVKAGSLAEAVTALQGFLAKYPRHDFADNAQYWLGEAFYAQHEYPRALAEFRGVIETYPRGNKVPDALLKVGYCYQALGQADKSRAVLEQVVNLYPKTPPAAIAAKRLETP
ncbi:MAG: tol-pal system protein YbgF [Deltaproteobacteria bacterium]|nr:tol-pal system protein YbgF [Deltaproteobacteria bacterium]MDQ3299621.1 tol-pal system protein YbgF [Myxococcota bacterium]